MAGELIAPRRASLLTLLEQQLAAWFGVGALLILVVLAAGSAIQPRQILDLSGSWQSAAGPLELPGRIDGDFTAHREVWLAEDGLYALRVDSPRYRLDVSWDGELVGGHAGDHTAVIPLPYSEAGGHELTVSVHGDFGTTGLIGPLQLGRANEMYAVSLGDETRGLAMILGLGLLAVVHLAVGLRRTHRTDSLALGLTAALMALIGVGLSDFAPAWVSTEVAIRVRTAAAALLPSMVLIFYAAFTLDRPRLTEIAWLPVGALLAVFVLLAPRSWLFSLETLVSAQVVLSLPWLFVVSLDALRRQPRPPHILLMGALVPLIVGAVSEILLQFALRGGTSHLSTALALFLAAASAALALQHASEAERHRRLVKGSVDAMVSLDRSGEITDANPAARRLLGLEGKGRGRRLANWVVRDDLPRLEAHLRHPGERTDLAEFRLLGPSGNEIVVESLATPVDQAQTLLVLRDVTQRRRLDRGLMQAARMETVGLLLGGIAHDFNNMLGTLLAHVGFLQVILEPKDPAQRRLSQMESTIERASLLTRRLLTVAGATGSNLEATDLAEVCRSAVELVRPTLGPGVNLHLDLADPLPPVLGSSTDLEHVLVNLLVNARDAVGEQGQLVVRARAFKTADGGRGVVVAVEDNGPGIPPDRRGEIFEPFVSTKTKGVGSGLGLAVAAKILKDHYGRIWAEERPGGGARFLMALRHADSVDEAPAPLPQNRVVLLVEDEEVLLQDYATALRSAGYVVHACSNGGDAWNWLQRSKPAILVTDVVMPGLSGIELATLSGELYPHIPVLIVSGFIPATAIEGLDEDKTWHRLNKPIRTARLVSTVGRLCRRAERAAQGQLDITQVTYLFPNLEDLSSEKLGLS